MDCRRAVDAPRLEALVRALSCLDGSLAVANLV